ncbi:AAA family ATPase [Bacillus cereus]
MICSFCEKEVAIWHLKYEQGLQNKRLDICGSCYEIYSDTIKMLFPFFIMEHGGAGKLTKTFKREKEGWTEVQERSSNPNKKSVKKVKTSEKDALLRFATKMNGNAFVFGRKQEIDDVLYTLKRKMKNTPLLIGHPGVGKTAVVEGVVAQIEESGWIKKGKQVEVWMLHLEELLKGSGVRGKLEENLSELLNSVKLRSNIVLFVDEFHMLLANNGMLANYLKPALARGELQLIGATTYKEYKDVMRDPAFERRMNVIDVKEPDENQTIEIVEDVVGLYEEYHSVKFKQESIKSSVWLAARYMPQRYFPDKALDLIDMAGARFPNQLISTKHIERIVEDVFNGVNRVGWKKKVDAMKKSVKGTGLLSEEEIEKLCNALYVKGMIPSMRNPLLRILCNNNSEAALEISEIISNTMYGASKVLEVNLMEYNDQTNITKLIGAPPGYIGHQNGGVITDAMLTEPSQVLLFTNWEYAHTEIQNWIRHILESGKTRDNEGRWLYFHNTIVIVTQDSSEAVIGFDYAENTTEQLELDGYDVTINLLDSSATWFEKWCKELESRWKRYGVEVVFDDSLMVWVNDEKTEVLKRVFNNGFERVMVDGYIQNTDKKVCEIRIEKGKPICKWINKGVTIWVGNTGQQDVSEL